MKSFRLPSFSAKCSHQVQFGMAITSRDALTINDPNLPKILLFSRFLKIAKSSLQCHTQWGSIPLFVLKFHYVIWIFAPKIKISNFKVSKSAKKKNSLKLKHSFFFLYLISFFGEKKLNLLKTLQKIDDFSKKKSGFLKEEIGSLKN